MLLTNCTFFDIITPFIKIYNTILGHFIYAQSLKVPICGGEFTPKELNSPNKIGNILFINLDIFSIGTPPEESQNYFIFTFKTYGVEIESTRDRIQLELCDKNNEILDYVADSFMDTRLAAKLSNRMGEPAEKTSITLCTPIRLAMVDKIVISVFRV
ncbi:MAG: hypothetical protein LBC20_17295 [Planctomycetaceae bacterium]|jgi:hypothetical protein|nr:hypothetical protein [Planctomycetaceae bacterium]